MWAYDFIFDTCADGRSLKCLTVVDEFTRECLAIDVAGSIRSGRVIDILGQLVSRHGAECLSLEWFRNRTEAKIGIERWRRHYNEERPHMSLGDLTPAEFKAQMGTTQVGWQRVQWASFSSNQWSEETRHVSGVRGDLVAVLTWG